MSNSLGSKALRRLAFYRDKYVLDKLFAERLYPAYARLAYSGRGRTPPDPAAVRSVLLWNLDSVGDFLWTTPTQRALRLGYPNAEITLVCNRLCRSLVEGSPNLDRIIGLDPKPFYRGGGLLRRVPELEGQRFDVMVIVEMGARPSDAGRVLGRRLDVGYLVSTDLGLLKHLPDHTLPPNADDIPATEYGPRHFLRAVEHLGLEAVPPRMELFTAPEDEVEVDAILGPADDRALIGLHPWVAAYGNATKKWPDASYVALAERLAARRPTRFVLTGGPENAAESEALAATIRERTGADAVSTAGRVSLRASAALLRRLAAFVVGDTANLHMALAVGAPVVTIFGATNQWLVAPESPRCLVVNAQLPCSPCHRPRDRMPFWPVCIFPDDKARCMRAVTPEQVEAAVERVLSAPAIMAELRP